MSIGEADVPGLFLDMSERGADTTLADDVVKAYFDIADRHYMELTAEDEDTFSQQIQSGLQLSSNLDDTQFPSHSPEAEIVVQAKRATDMLVLTNLRWAAVTANKFPWSSLSEGDLLHQGVAGLTRATKTFNPQKGRFKTYATFWIKEEIRAALANTEYGLRAPRGQQEKLAKVLGDLQEDPTKSFLDVCAERGFDPERVQAAAAARRISSIHIPVSIGEGGEDGTLVEDTLKDPIDYIALADDRLDFSALWSGIKQVIYSRYNEEDAARLLYILRGRIIDQDTLTDVGRGLGGLSHERVRQLQGEALAMLRSVGERALYDLGYHQDDIPELEEPDLQPLLDGVDIRDLGLSDSQAIALTYYHFEYTETEIAECMEMPVKRIHMLIETGLRAFTMKQATPEQTLA